ncbi:hypothetical protein KBD08_02905 [Candidatus Babeliales bacterium]|nr:hypothetical protein [Candidatus Babeliales bacterium]
MKKHSIYYILFCINFTHFTYSADSNELSQRQDADTMRSSLKEKILKARTSMLRPCSEAVSHSDERRDSQQSNSSILALPMFESVRVNNDSDTSQADSSTSNSGKSFPFTKDADMSCNEEAEALFNLSSHSESDHCNPPTPQQRLRRAANLARHRHSLRPTTSPVFSKPAPLISLLSNEQHPVTRDVYSEATLSNVSHTQEFSDSILEDLQTPAATVNTVQSSAQSSRQRRLSTTVLTSTLSATAFVAGWLGHSAMQPKKRFITGLEVMAATEGLSMAGKGIAAAGCCLAIAGAYRMISNTLHASCKEKAAAIKREGEANVQAARQKFNAEWHADFTSYKDEQSKQLVETGRNLQQALERHRVYTRETIEPLVDAVEQAAEILEHVQLTPQQAKVFQRTASNMMLAARSAQHDIDQERAQSTITIIPPYQAKEKTGCCCSS